jgi:hypothetical protein
LLRAAKHGLTALLYAGIQPLGNKRLDSGSQPRLSFIFIEKQEAVSLDQQNDIDIWSLSLAQLAEQCRLIAEGNSTAIDKKLQDEASRLYMSWTNAFDQHGDNSFEQERKALHRAGLKRRTIEILVKINRNR